MCFYKVRSKLYFKHQRTVWHHFFLFFLIARGMSLNKNIVFINKSIHHVVRHSPGWTLINDLLVSCECKAWAVTLGSYTGRKILIPTVLQNTNHKNWAAKLTVLSQGKGLDHCFYCSCLHEEKILNKQPKMSTFLIHSYKVVAEGSFEGDIYWEVNISSSTSGT